MALSAAQSLSLVRRIVAAILLIPGGARIAPGGFAVQLAAGIALVHAREGWFVVGLGRNGVEFSVLLIGCLVALALAQEPTRK